jgi:hypothetical protein
MNPRVIFDPNQCIDGLVEVHCETCEEVVFLTTAKRVLALPEIERFCLVHHFTKHRKASGKPCTPPPFEELVQAASLYPFHAQENR